MIDRIFNNWLDKASKLTEKQTAAAIAKLQKAVTIHFDGRPPEDKVPPSIADTVATACPHCSHEKLAKNGWASGLQRWKCGGCGKTFNILTKTPLARLRKKEKWLTNAESMIDGLSITQTAFRCRVSRSTGFRWRHRFAEFLSRAQCTKMSGIAECDITKFYDSEKGNRNLDRKPRLRGGHNIKKGSAQLVSVITLQDRSGNGAERITKHKVRLHAYDLFKVHLNPDTLLFTDGDKNLCAAMKDVCAAAEERNPDAHTALVGKKRSRGKKDNPYHIQTVNAFHSHLRRWIAQFHGVATKYLANYVGWYRQIKEQHFKNDPNLFIQLAFSPLSLNPQLTLT